MPYRTMGRIHANVARLWREASGQGTVEYVGLMLLLATLLAGVVAVAGGMKGGGIAQEIATKLKETISSVGEAKR
jgi:Flp pilus assembly pilin Flp